MSSALEKWGYGTLAVTILSTISLVGVVFLKQLQKKNWVYFSDFLIGLG